MKEKAENMDICWKDWGCWQILRLTLVHTVSSTKCVVTLVATRVGVLSSSLKFLASESPLSLVTYPSRTSNYSRAFHESHSDSHVTLEALRGGIDLLQKRAETMT